MNTRLAYPTLAHVWIAANSLPASSGTNTRDFMCFFLFWLISLPVIWFPLHKMFVLMCCRGFEKLGLMSSGKSALLRGEDDRYTHSRNRVLGLVHRQGPRHRSDSAPAFHHSRVESRLGHGREPHVLYQQLSNSHHVRPCPTFHLLLLTGGYTGMRPTLRRGQERLLRHFTLSSSRSP